MRVYAKGYLWVLLYKNFRVICHRQFLRCIADKAFLYFLYISSMLFIYVYSNSASSFFIMLEYL